MTSAEKRKAYKETLNRIELLLDEDTDFVAAMATIVCELHHAFDCFHWTGFYRTIRPSHLQVGPYQGNHGCIDIAFTKGVCGAAASTRHTQRVPDVSKFPGHIDCSPSTQSEIVVPILTNAGKTLAVLDVDSDVPAAFDDVDQYYLERLCSRLGERYGD